MTATKRLNGERDVGYLKNSVIISRNQGYIGKLTADKSAIIPYMDGYKIMPVEVESLEKIELLDNAFDRYVGLQRPQIVFNSCAICKIRQRLKSWFLR